MRTLQAELRTCGRERKPAGAEQGAHRFAFSGSNVKNARKIAFFKFSAAASSESDFCARRGFVLLSDIRKIRLREEFVESSNLMNGI